MNRAAILAVASGLLIAGSLAEAHEQGTWVLRAGAGQVSPKSGNLDLGSLDLGGGLSLDSASVEVDHGWSLVLSGTYMLTENWGFDVLASAPFNHDIDVKATVTNAGQTTTVRIPLGNTSHLPPTFSLQYHSAPDSQVQPYVGLWVNWTTFFDEDLTNVAEGAGFQDFSLDDSIGVAVQLGMDLAFSERWLVNFDARWANIETDVSATIDVGDGPVTGNLGSVEIDPWVYQVNLGYRF